MKILVDHNFNFHKLEEVDSPSNLSKAVQIEFEGVSVYLVNNFDYSYSTAANIAEEKFFCRLFGVLVDPFKKVFEGKVFFPGTFDPFHAGHEECIKQLRELKSGHKIILAPDLNPQKDSELTNPLAKFYELREKFSNDIDVVIYPGFLGMSERNPTSNWIKNIEGTRSLLMGEDSFYNLKTWINYEDLIKELDEIVVIPRLGTNEQFNSALSDLKKINPDLSAQRLQSHPFEKLSSSQLRL